MLNTTRNTKRRNIDHNDDNDQDSYRDNKTKNCNFSIFLFIFQNRVETEHYLRTISEI